MNALSPSVSRFVAVALLLLAIFFVIFNLLVPMISYYSEQYDEVELANRQLNRFEFLIANEPVINEQLERIETMGEQGDLFLKGNKKAIASANLREFVNEVVSRSGGQLVSSQEYEADPIPSATPIGLRLQVSGEVENLVNLLYELENARPLIFIDDLTVTSNSSRSRSSREINSRRVVRNTSPRNSLDVRLDVVGYLPGSQE